MDTQFAPDYAAFLEDRYDMDFNWRISLLQFKLTAEGLEEMLVNATLSAVALGLWTTQVMAKEKLYTSFYDFNRPAAILVPYAITLGFSFLFVCLGMVSLRSNGVMAEDVGFLQVACTTTGNAAFERAAASGCLGGEANTGSNKALADMVLIYGELIDADDAKGCGGGRRAVRRAGFGPVDQVRPLEPSGWYGVSSNDGEEGQPLLM